jgi:FixJ family two-component response regulator
MIYIIDDDQYVRRGFGLLLKSGGFESTSFSSAEEFLEKYNPDNTALVILDYHLPGMTACDLLEYFAKSKLYFPVVIITTFDDQQSRACAKKYGVVAYMRKPVDGEALIDIIKYALPIMNH